jgi:hypothetical protein
LNVLRKKNTHTSKRYFAAVSPLQEQPAETALKHCKERSSPLRAAGPLQ